MRARARLSRALTVASAAVATAESLQLRQLQVIHRHGDRTPITPLADRAFWSSVLPSEAELASLEDGTTVLRLSDSKPHPASGDGLFGTLSLRGVRMMREVGAELRRTYPSLLHEDLPLSADDVRVHCTDFPRTVQSVQALLQGLCPLEQRGEPIPIDCSLSDAMIPDPVPRATEEQAACEAAVLRSDAVLRHAAEVEPLRLRYSQVGAAPRPTAATSLARPDSSPILAHASSPSLAGVARGGHTRPTRLRAQRHGRGRRGVCSAGGWRAGPTLVEQAGRGPQVPAGLRAAAALADR